MRLPSHRCWLRGPFAVDFASKSPCIATAPWITQNGLTAAASPLHVLRQLEQQNAKASASHGEVTLRVPWSIDACSEKILDTDSDDSQSCARVK